MIRRWVLPATLLLLTAGSWWLLDVLDPDGPDGGGQSQDVPDYFIKDFTTTTMDLEGRPKRRLEAVLLVHYPDADMSELTEPYMVMYHPTRQPWHVRSEHGRVLAGGEVIFLLGKVHIWRNDADGVRQMDINTRDMRILPNSDYGETDKLAVIRNPTSVSRGIGMRAHLAQRRVELLSQVQTLYENERN